MLLFRDLLDRRTLVEIVNFTIDFFFVMSAIWLRFEFDLN